MNKKIDFLTRIVAICIVVFFALFFGYSLLASNINGDAIFHTLTTKELLSNGTIPAYAPNFIMDISPLGETLHYPVHFPYNNYYIWSLFYLIGGSKLLQFSGLFFMVGSLYFLYRIFIQVTKNKLFSIFIATIVILSVIYRFLMSPLMEQPVIFFSLLVIFLTIKIIKYNQINISSVIFIGLSLGLLSTTKQSGMIIAFLILPSILFALRRYKRLILVMLIIMSIPMVGYYGEQIHRTGTIGYTPGNTVLPGNSKISNFVNTQLFHSKFPSNILSNSKNQKRLSYSIDEISLSPTLNDFFSNIINGWSSKEYIQNQGWIILFFLFLIGIRASFSGNKQVGILIGLVIFGEIITTLIFKHSIYNYHIIGIILINGIILYGVMQGKFPKGIKIIFISLLLLLFFTNNFNAYMERTYAGSGRLDTHGKGNNALLSQYPKLCKYINEKDLKSKIFMSADSNFRYKCDVDIFWINEGGGTYIPEIMGSEDDVLSYRLIKKHYPSIKYIFIDKNQARRRGLYDYIKRGGIKKFKKSNLFTIEYESKDLLLIYIH